jgi:hypothetical protein
LALVDTWWTSKRGKHEGGARRVIGQLDSMIGTCPVSAFNRTCPRFELGPRLLVTLQLIWWYSASFSNQ